MTNKAVSAGTLLNPVKLYKFLDAVTSSVTTDDKLNKLNKLVDLASQFKDIGLSKIQFLTMFGTRMTNVASRQIFCTEPRGLRFH